MIDNTKTSKLFVDLVNIVEKLRSPEGCPWDKEQTHESLLPYFLEEAYEVIESIELKDWETLKEELGDVLLHILLQAKIADETNKFNISDSLETINNKLVNRHPHVFGDDNIGASVEAKQNWEDIKHVEKKRKSRLDGVPNKLPALVRAQRLQEKASYAGFDHDNIEDAWEKLNEELNELKSAHKKRDIENVKEEIGDVLFSVVNLSRFFDIPAEDMLRQTNRKFITRFQTIERELNEKGKKLEDSTLEEMEKIWEKSKE